MDKREIAAAGMLLNTYEQAQRTADQLDPARKRGRDCVVKLDQMSRMAADAFLALTGRIPVECQSWEFNTETPAEWVKAVPSRRDRI